MKVNVLAVAGLVLAILGLLFLLGVGIPGTETFSAGPISASVETERAVHPAIAVVLLVAGLAAMAFGQKRA